MELGALSFSLTPLFYQLVLAVLICIALKVMGVMSCK